MPKPPRMNVDRRTASTRIWRKLLREEEAERLAEVRKIKVVRQPGWFTPPYDDHDLSTSMLSVDGPASPPGGRWATPVPHDRRNRTGRDGRRKVRAVSRD